MTFPLAGNVAPSAGETSATVGGVVSCPPLPELDELLYYED